MTTRESSLQSSDIAAAMSFVEQHVHSSDGLRLRYAVAGQGSAVLLLHPFSDSMESWWELGIGPRLARSARVIAYDARGHGGSDKPHHPARHCLDLRVDDALAVLDAAGVAAAHVVGYSMGGWTALGLAARAPERLCSLTVGGAHPFAQDLTWLRRLLAGGWPGWREVLERSLGTLSPTWLARAGANDLAALAAVVAEDRADQSAGLSDLALPVRWIVGARDPAHDQVLRAAALTADATVRVVARADHFQTFASAPFADAVVGLAAPKVWS